MMVFLNHLFLMQRMQLYRMLQSDRTVVMDKPHNGSQLGAA